MKKEIAEALEKRISLLENKVDVMKINNMPTNEACGIEIEPEYVITKAQLELIDKEGSGYVREWFPDAFKEDKVELVSGWMKHKDNMHPDWLWYVNFETGGNYGFMANGEWSDTAKDQIEYVKVRCVNVSNDVVVEALTKEAVKRYKVGDYVKSINSQRIYKIHYDDFDLPNNTWLKMNGICVFKEGVWSTVVENITKEDAEKELGKKILN